MLNLHNFFDTNNFDAELLWNEPMSNHSSFKIGGSADVLVKPANKKTLSNIIQSAKVKNIPCIVIGCGANILVSDLGIRGIVITTESMNKIHVDGTSIYAEAGAKVTELVKASLQHSLAGLDFAAGLPGSVGGAVYMNARCYNNEFADLVSKVDYINYSDGTESSLYVDKNEWEYKKTPFMQNGKLNTAIITGAYFNLQNGEPSKLAARIAELELDRKAKGHFDYPSAGSLFKNNRAFGKPTGQILDELGFRGKRVGDAMVSPKHANIFVNAGNATASDMLLLINEAKNAAQKYLGITLEPEVVMLGKF